MLDKLDAALRFSRKRLTMRPAAGDFSRHIANADTPGYQARY